MKAKIAKRFLLLCVALTIAVVVTFGRHGNPSKTVDKISAAADALALRKPTSLGANVNDESALSSELQSGLPEIPVFQAPDSDTKKTNKNAPDANALDANDSEPKDAEPNTSPTRNTLADQPVGGLSGLPNLAPLPSLATPSMPSATPGSPTASATPLPDLTPKNTNLPTGPETQNNDALNLFPKLPSLPPLNVDSPSPKLPTPSAAPETNVTSAPQSSSANELLDLIRAPSSESRESSVPTNASARPLAPAKPNASAGLPPMFSLAPQRSKPTPSNPSPAQPKAEPLPEHAAPAPDEPFAQFAQLAKKPAPVAPRAAPALPDLSNLKKPEPLQTQPNLPSLQPNAIPQTLPSFINSANKANPAPPVAGFGTPIANPNPPLRSAPREPQPMNRAESRELRHHRIVDGDTLGTISKRYHGSPDRAMEIFEANRQVLRTPDLLPLGARLVVPVPSRSPVPDTATNPFLPRSATPPATNGMRAIPETTRQVLTPRPTITESGRVQEIRPQTRLVPVPRG